MPSSPTGSLRAAVTTWSRTSRSSTRSLRWSWPCARRSSRTTSSTASTSSTSKWWQTTTLQSSNAPSWSTRARSLILPTSWCGNPPVDRVFVWCYTIDILRSLNDLPRRLYCSRHHGV